MSEPNTRTHAQAPADTLEPDDPPQPHDAPIEAKPKRRLGFAAMDPKLVSEISRKGGKAAHAAGSAHEFTSEEARAAGRKGGLATHTRRKERRDSTAPMKPADH